MLRATGHARDCQTLAAANKEMKHNEILLNVKMGRNVRQARAATGHARMVTARSGLACYMAHA